MGRLEAGLRGAACQAAGAPRFEPAGGLASSRLGVAASRAATLSAEQQRRQGTA
jgi:hypothetical protein